MPFISEETAQTYASGAVKVAVFVLIKTGADSPANWIRVWSGTGDIELPAGLIDTAGGVYLGMGDLVGLPSFSQLLNGVAERIEFVLSGCSPEVIALADQDAEDVRGAAAHIGIIGLDWSEQTIGDPLWLWEGETDVPRTRKQSVISEDGTGSILRSVSLSAVSAFSGRRRPPLGYFTGVDQRRRSPGDAFCDRANIYHQGRTRKFP